MWIKVDDRFPEHQKVVRAAAHLGSNGIGRVLAVWIEAMCYCGRNLTDGFLPDIIARSLKADRRPMDVLSVFAMDDVRLMHRVEHGFQFHDYEDYQPSAADIKAKRKKDLERKRGRQPGGESNGNRSGIAHDSTRNREGFQSARARAPDVRRAERAPSRRVRALPAGSEAGVMFGGFHRRRRVTAADLAGGPPRKRAPRINIPRCPSSRLEVIDGTARFTIDRELYSPNKTLWASPEQKKRDRDSWGVAIYGAIVTYLLAEGHELSVVDTQRIANRRIPTTNHDGRVVVRRLHRAPQQHYRLTIIREVPKLANFIRDDDNLAFAGKALRDALQAHCVIYEDSRAWLTHPLPIQRVAEDGQYRTIVDVTPWAQPRLSGATHAAGQ